MEAGRGIAAALVVAYHANKYYFGSAHYWTRPAFHRFFAFGNAGVEFFFVLSGFIIALIHWDDLGVRGRVRPFLEKRFTRLYPFYWVCVAAAVAVFLAVPSFGEAKNRALENIVSSFLLVGRNPHDAVIFVSWTLYHEIFFYVLAAVAIWRPKVGLTAMAVWAAGCAAAGVMNLGVPYPFASVNLLFPMGIGCALWLRHRSVPAPATCLVVGTVLFLATGLDQDYADALGGLLRELSYGVATSLVLLGAVEVERSRGWRAPRALVGAGKASYAVYLTHMLSLAFAAKLAEHFGAPRLVPAPVGFLALLAVGIAVGVAAHRYLEAPAIAWTRERFAARRARGRVAVAPHVAEPEPVRA